jgi:hypothetical protein
VSDIETVVVDSLKALDPEWPIREADMAGRLMSTRPNMKSGVIRKSAREACSNTRRPSRALEANQIYSS